MKYQPAARLPPRQAQGGYILPQLAVAALIGSLLMGYIGNRIWQGQVNQMRDDSARSVGSKLATINDATKTYATSFFTQIQRGQSVTRNGYTLGPERLLAPTLADLSGLGFLPARALSPAVYSGRAIGFNVQLSVDTQSGCTVPTCNLLFQVTTSAPLLKAGSSNVDVQRATIAANTASPANSGVSLPASMGGDPTVFVGRDGNPVGSNPGGVAGLVVIRNGYDSSGFMEFDRRDGSLPRTGDINMQDGAGSKHNINNAGTVAAVATTTGTLQVTGLAKEGDRCSQIGLIASNTSGKLLGCNGSLWGKATDMPNAHRYLFTSTTNWTVPAGVKSALVTMAGGGSSGSGWRFSSPLKTGSSGGFVFSAPINLVEGEVITVVVGAGGVGFAPYDSGVPTIPYPQYNVVAPPAGDDGLGGYPGGASKIISPTAGVLLECAGGSGAWAEGVDSFSGGFVPGNVRGAVNGTGYPQFPSPNRKADGPYASDNGGPGACGLNGYGIGNWGTATYALENSVIPAGTFSGGLSPFGYGTGGSVQVQGCFVSSIQGGTCIYPRNGRDGIVMIDVLY